MTRIDRRNALSVAALAATLWLAASPLASAQPPTVAPLPRAAPGAPASLAKAPRLAAKLRIVIPANPGGGWDQTGRALGAALVAVGAAEQVEYDPIFLSYPVATASGSLVLGTKARILSAM